MFVKGEAVNANNVKNFALKVSGAVTMVGVLGATAYAKIPDQLGVGITDASPTGASDKLFGKGGVFTAIADTLIYLVGAIAVIMLIIGGFRYVLSAGNSSAVESAKNTILYAVIGIVVAALAFAAVKFVATQLT